MKSIILLIGLALFSLAVNAQEFPSDLWHDGKLVLVSEDTLIGKIKYNQAQGIVQVEIGEKTYTHSSNSIFNFEIFDLTVESYRVFYVLPYGLVTSYKTPAIFEVLVEGNLTLLSRESIVTKNIQNPYSYGNYAKETLIYDYFFLDRKGAITKYTLKKKDLYTAVAKRQSQVIDFMKANKLHHDQRNDLVRIIAFYNALL